VSTDDALLLGLGENVHYAAVSRSPITLGDTVDEDNVEVLSAQLTAEAIEVGTHSRRIAGVCLGKDNDLVPWKLSESGSDVGMASVRVGRVKEAQAVLVVPVEQEGHKTGGSKVCLI
jgi:hypothetical protein